MNLTPKQKSNISKNIKVIMEDKFDEKHVKELLIDIREFVPGKSLVRELGDFIAHYERNTGKYHSLFNIRHATIELLGEDKVSGSLIFKMNTSKVKKDLYEAVFVYGLEQCYKAYKMTGKNVMNADKEVIESIIKKSYKLQGKYYELVPNANMVAVMHIAKNILTWFSNAPLMSENELFDAFIIDINNFCKKHLKNIKFKIANRDDLVLCIISLLQDASFLLFDGSYAKFELRAIGQVMRLKQTEIDNDPINLAIVGGIVVNGYVTRPSLFFISSVDPRLVMIGGNNIDYLNSIPSVYTKRDESGNLKLCLYE